MHSRTNLLIAKIPFWMHGNTSQGVISFLMFTVNIVMMMMTSGGLVGDIASIFSVIIIDSSVHTGIARVFCLLSSISPIVMIIPFMSIH